MPVINRKRRAQVDFSDPPPPTQRRPSPPGSDASALEEDFSDAGEEDGSTQARTSQEQMVKKLVRLALASEYSRRPIRREDITKKVLAPNMGRQFHHILKAANDHLIHTFGMTLTELPAREKVTVAQKRAAQRSAGNNSNKNPSSAHHSNSDLPATQNHAAIANSLNTSSSKQYIVTSTLPSRYCHPSILPPSRIPTQSHEASYVGLTTFVLSLIYLSPGNTLSESRLEKHLRTLNADDFVLGEKTERGVLARMQREGYIVKVRERGAAEAGGEDSVDFVVGPRGRVEVGEKGVAGLVRRVYGEDGGDEVEKRLVRSLGDVVIQKKAEIIREDGVNGVGEEERNQGAAEQMEREGRGGRVNGTNGVEFERRQTVKSSSKKRRRRREEEEEDENEEDQEDQEIEEEEEEEEEVEEGGGG